jgi:beta-mannosidase
MHPWGNTMLATYHSPLSSQVVQNKKVKDNVKVILELSYDNKVCFQKEFSPYMIEGRSWMEEEFEIPNPKLWFPNGMGNQNLYVATLKLEVNKNVVDVVSFDFGVRTIEHVRSAGIRTQDRWADWQYVINGKKAIHKGNELDAIGCVIRFKLRKIRLVYFRCKKCRYPNVSHLG